MTDLAPTEIMALSRILDELDYYRILHLTPQASAGEIRQAYHASSRVFHPDANRHLDPPMRMAVEQIAKRLTEAYTVLRDPRRRHAYDEVLAEGTNRMQIAEAEARAEQQATEELQGRTPNGRRYSALAQSDLGRGDLVAAVRNLQTAATFEPDNLRFKEKIAELRKELEAQRRASR